MMSLAGQEADSISTELSSYQGISCCLIPQILTYIIRCLSESRVYLRRLKLSISR